MSVALHDRLIGRPAKAAGLIRFLEHVRKHDKVWICTGRDIAEHWRREHPPPELAARTIARYRRYPPEKRDESATAIILSLKYFPADIARCEAATTAGPGVWGVVTLRSGRPIRPKGRQTVPVGDAICLALQGGRLRRSTRARSAACPR